MEASLNLVLGADGYIGNHLRNRLCCFGTSRRPSSNLRHFDALNPNWDKLCGFDVIYVCLAANGAKNCEGSQDSFRVNVDFPIELAVRKPAFIVWLGSQSVEWMDGAYPRQKLACETVLRTMPWVGIVRSGRVLNTQIDDLCSEIIRVGTNRIGGVTRWGSDDTAYEKEQRA